MKKRHFESGTNDDGSQQLADADGADGLPTNERYVVDVKYKELNSYNVLNILFESRLILFL